METAAERVSANPWSLACWLASDVVWSDRASGACGRCHFPRESRRDTGGQPTRMVAVSSARNRGPLLPFAHVPHRAVRVNSAGANSWSVKATKADATRRSLLFKELEWRYGPPEGTATPTTSDTTAGRPTVDNTRRGYPDFVVLRRSKADLQNAPRITY